MRTKKLNQTRPSWKSIFCFFMMAIALLVANLAHAQDPPQYGTPFTGVPDPRDANIYQVHNRPYSAAGNFAGIVARLDSIKALGTNVVYIMPIYPHGTDSRSSASPYSIKGYDSVATEYGTLTDFRNLVAGCHSRGMAVILDIAVNGTSWDHPWITQNPSWYVQSGGVIQQFSSFSDVAALDFTNTTMRAAMVQAMRYWIFAANIDGFRCDDANAPPVDFWTNTIANLRGITTHKLLMLAEGDRQANYTAGFDYDFGDDFYYQGLTQVVGGSAVTVLQTVTNTEYTDATGTQMMARYTSNHDIETSTTAIQEFGGHAGVIANYLVCAYMRGVPFLTSGQEVDFNQLIPWPYQTVKINWTANLGASADFKKVINYRIASEAIRRGTMANFSDNNTCAFTKTSTTTSEKVIVMVNMRNSNENYVIPAAIAGNYKNSYTGASVTLTSGATQALTPFQYIVLTNQNVATVAVTGVSVSPTTASIAAGLTQQLTPTVAPSNASNQNVTWASSNTAVATVSAAGLVTAVAAGTATITVTTQDGGKTATCAVTVTASSHFTVYFYRPSTWGTGINIYWWSALPAGVLADGTWPGVACTNTGNNWYSYTFTNVTSTNLIFNDGNNQTANLSRAGTNGWYYNGNWYNSQPNPVTGVTVSPTTATLAVNGTQQLTATVAPSNATIPGVTWASSNTAVATVSTAGLVTAVAAGTATITVTTTDNGFTATSAITVNTTNVPVTGVTMNPTTASVAVGSTQQLTATIAPTNATNKTVTWSSSNTAIATVSTSGLVTAVAAGTATITVTTQDGSKTATCAITATTVAVTGVTLAPTTTSLSVGGTQQLTPTISPSNATNKAVTYSSSNTAIAMVSAVGLVTAVAAGTATVTVKTTDGSKTATCAVTVTATSGFTVYFYRPSTWGTGIKIYWWSALPAGNLADGTWPGVSMTNTSGNWYSYTFANITSTNLIFNDGSNQTANLNRGSNGWYYNGNWYNTQPVPVTGVTISPTTASAAVGATAQLTASLVPSNATVTGVTWASSNTAVATVSSTGLVTGVAAGAASVTATTNDNGFVATCSVTITSSGSVTYYNILNRWQANTYLYDGGNGQVKYGTSPSGNNNYLWAQVAGPTGYIYLQNLATGNLMNVEDQNGAIEANTANTTWYSAMWSVVSTGDSWYYLENRWQTSDWINIQALAGYAQYSGASAGFYSAEWQFVNPTVHNMSLRPEVTFAPPPVILSGIEPVVHPALSPNGDGINDVLTIDNIAAYPENKLMVMSVSGAKVFEAANYDNYNKAFDGRSSITGQLMPRGTYFYMLQYKDKGVIKSKTGYIVLKY